MSERYTGERGDSGERGVAGERGPKGDHGQDGRAGLPGQPGVEGQPGQDWHWKPWAALRLLAFVLVAVAAIYASAVSFQTADKATKAASAANTAAQDAKRALNASERQRRDARDQICHGDEREHLRYVQRVNNTYAYLEQLKPDEYEQSFNLAIIRQLPEIEREADEDTAPAFCDDPGMGIKEPDAKRDKRSPKIKMLVRLERQHLGD